MEQDTSRYLELEIEDEVNVIRTGGGADVGEGTLTITQGGVAKGTFNANSKSDVTIALEEAKCEVTKAEFDAEVVRAKAREDENTEAITEEIDRATAKEAELEAKFEEYAPLVSPALTGTPTAPTATAGTNTTQIATTAFVTDAIETAITEVENGYY